MWKIVLFVSIWFLCYDVEIVKTSYISDITLRSTTSCPEKQCDSNRDCHQNRNLICSDGYCVCKDEHAYFNGSCRGCYPCKYIEQFQCISECCPTFCDGRTCISSNGSSGQDILLTATQIAMTGALILGIITIIALLWKMCSKNDYRSRPATTRNQRSPRLRAPRHSGDSTASGGSLQRAVAVRLRDAPPPYITSTPLPPPGDTPPPYHLLAAQGYVNESFEAEGNVPPPQYSVAILISNNSNTTQTINANSNNGNTANEDIKPDVEPNNRNNNKDTTVPEASTVHI